MAQPHVVSALIDKRAEIAGQILEAERHITRLRADLAHVDASLRMFDPEIRPSDIRPRVPRSRMTNFKRSEMTRLCRDILRDAKGTQLSAGEIIERAIQAKGLDPFDKDLRREMLLRFLWALHALHGQGEIGKVGFGKDVRWTLPSAGE